MYYLNMFLFLCESVCAPPTQDLSVPWLHKLHIFIPISLSVFSMDYLHRHFLPNYFLYQLFVYYGFSLLKVETSFLKQSIVLVNDEIKCLFIYRKNQPGLKNATKKWDFHPLLIGFSWPLLICLNGFELPCMLRS